MTDEAQLEIEGLRAKLGQAAEALFEIQRIAHHNRKPGVKIAAMAELATEAYRLLKDKSD